MDIAAIHAYIVRDSEKYADMMVSRIEASLVRIAQFPEAGRPTRLLDVREVIVAPYFVRYRVRRQQKAIDILRVLHGRQHPSFSE